MSTTGLNSLETSNFVETTLNPLEEPQFGEETWDRRRQAESELADYLIELGYDERHSRRQAEEIVTDTVIGDLEEAQQKIEALETLKKEFDMPTVEDVKSAAVEFYEIQERFDRSSDIYFAAKQEFEDTAVEYLDSNLSIPNPRTQANRLVTETSLGNAHIYETLEKIDAIQKMQDKYGVEN